MLLGSLEHHSFTGAVRSRSFLEPSSRPHEKAQYPGLLQPHSSASSPFVLSSSLEGASVPGSFLIPAVHTFLCAGAFLPVMHLDLWRFVSLFLRFCQELLSWGPAMGFQVSGKPEALHVSLCVCTSTCSARVSEKRV